jgi:3-hydroxybutyryl-CoA dehydrogenase
VTTSPEPGATAQLRAAVVGAGTMGYAIAQLLALAGIPCRIADVTPARAEAGRERAVEGARALEQAGLFAAGAEDAVAANLLPAPSLAEAVRGADVVFEAVAEEIAVKQAVYAEIEREALGRCVIATNTSAIPIRELAAALEHPERFLGAHWFNPPQWVPCVELIPGPRTAEAARELVASVLLGLGKQPVVVGDSAGFVSNRIQFAMFKEAAAVVADGVASAEEVDRIVRASFGFRLAAFGPFAIADMAGLDVYAGAYAALEAELGPRFSPPPSLLELVGCGRFGTKAGGGFLDIPAGQAPALEARRDAAYAALGRLVAENGLWNDDDAV